MATVVIGASILQRIADFEAARPHSRANTRATCAVCHAPVSRWDGGRFLALAGRRAATHIFRAACLASARSSFGHLCQAPCLHKEGAIGQVISPAEILTNSPHSGHFFTSVGNWLVRVNMSGLVPGDLLPRRCGAANQQSSPILLCTGRPALFT
jgi:hypothetical protein